MGLDTRGRNKKCEALNRGNPYDEVADCWVAKEKTCSVFKTPNPNLKRSDKSF